MTGAFENNQLTLNRFDGINCRVFKATLTPHGALEGFVDLGLFNPKRKIVAERLTAENKSSVANLPDPNKYTKMSNSAEPFRFSFPDPDGKSISSTDERFKNKVVVVTITGSWCPNCYDEAPVLQEFYERYRERGLEVVALSFEYTGDAARDAKRCGSSPNRLRHVSDTLRWRNRGGGKEAFTTGQFRRLSDDDDLHWARRSGELQLHAGFEGKATGERFTRLKADGSVDPGLA